MPSDSYLMSYISDIFYVKYVDSFVVSWFLLLGNHDSASAAIFSLPGIYSISGTYYYNISLNHNTLSVFKFLRVTFLWSVDIFNC